jgi:DNA replication and repair protein RecF
MYLKNLKLVNFRNFKKNKFEFSGRITTIVGDNTTGKTNILEAIYLLASGKSFKAKLENEMITYGKEIARVSGGIQGDRNTDLEVVLTNGKVQIGDDPKNIKSTQKKKLLVNGIPRRLIDFAGNLRVVLFGPWDMDLVTESPSIRRRFLDFVLSQTDREYRRSVMIYEKGLRQRNRLLLRIRDENVPRTQLLYWDKLLIKHGEYLTKKREELIDDINGYQFPIQNRMWRYLNRRSNYQLIYDKSVISEGRLAQYAGEEAAAAITLVGPHRDDFTFRVKEQESKRVKRDRNYPMDEDGVESQLSRNLATFGSRGEQRMGVLWLKLAELSYIESVTGEEPILLLDDIFSELDHEHRDIVMEMVKGREKEKWSGQVIITTADPHNVEGIEGKIIKISNL